MKKFILFILLPIIISGCTLIPKKNSQPASNTNQEANQNTDTTTDQNSCSFESFTYNLDLGVCSFMMGTQCTTPSFVDKLKECEGKNKLTNLDIEAVDFCTKLADKISPSSQQNKEAMSVIKNDCLLNMAIAQKKISVCEGISSELSKNNCLDYVNKSKDR